MTALRSTGLLLCLAACAAIAHAQPGVERLSSLREDFLSPPPENRPLVTWWWFASPLSREDLARELEQIKAAGFGGVQVQFELSPYPDSPRVNVDAPPMLDAIKIASLKAKQLGLSFQVLFETGLSLGQRLESADRLAWVRRIASTIESGSSHALAFSPMVGASRDEGFYAAFKLRRGYDLKAREGQKTEKPADREELRHDLALTTFEQLDDRNYAPLRKLARDLKLPTRMPYPNHGTGSSAISKSMDEPMGSIEGWNTFSSLRLAASAAHHQGNPLVIGSAWTKLDRGSHSATPLDLKINADLRFLAGATQILGNGWTAPSLPSATWCHGEAALLNQNTPWLSILPELSRYLQRVGYLLRQGTSAEDIAVYLPFHDALADLPEASLDLIAALSERMGPALLPMLLREGYRVDFVDDDALAMPSEGNTKFPAARVTDYPILILPNVERLPKATLVHLDRYLGKGGNLVFLGRLPARTPSPDGTRSGSEDLLAAVEGLCLLHKESCFRPPQLTGDLGKILRKLLPPDLLTTPGAPTLGFVHRHLPDAEVYFIANTNNLPYSGSVTTRGKKRAAEWWDPLTGDSWPAIPLPKSGQEASFELSLPAYGARFLVLFQGSAPNKPPRGDQAKRNQKEAQPIRDITNGWEVTFVGTQSPKRFDWPVSWTEFADTRFFSGEAVYRKPINLPAKLLAGGAITLSLGEATPSPLPEGKSGVGNRASLESPVREAAIVLVNGQRVGSIWSPPYELEIGKALVQGPNDLEIRVYNVAANQLAGRPLGQPASLDASQPQQGPTIKAVPAGLLGPIVLKGR